MEAIHNGINVRIVNMKGVPIHATVLEKGEGYQPDDILYAKAGTRGEKQAFAIKDSLSKRQLDKKNQHH